MQLQSPPSGQTGPSPSGAAPRVCSLLSILGLLLAASASLAAEPGTGTPLALARGEIRQVANTAALNAALDDANRAQVAMTLLLGDGTYVLDVPGLDLRCPGLVVRSASGNRDAVIVRGPDEGPQAAVANIFTVSANDVVIADLTLGHCRHHGIQVRGEGPFDVAGLRVHNCRLVNCNEQFIKGSSSDADPVGATGGCIEQCLFEFTRGWAYQSYTGGIDIHKGVDWVVRDNLFRNLRTPAGQSGVAEHAIHFWKRCPTLPQNVRVERNRIVNCDRGIGFGLVNAEGGHQGGGSVIRHNQVFNDGTGPHTDVGIGLEHATGVEVDHNTVVIQNYWAPVEYRFAGSSNLVFRNNLVSRPIQARDGAPPAFQTNNLERTDASWFRDFAAGDLRLTPVTVPAGNANPTSNSRRDDTEARPRPHGTGWDVGAYEPSGEPPAAPTGPGAPASGTPRGLEVQIVDAATGQPIACTVTLVDANGRTVTEGEGLRGAFRSSGVVAKDLAPGRTRIRVTRGPEYRAAETEVELRAGATSRVELRLERQVDLRRRGWYAGDSHVHMIHGERTVSVGFDDVALAARAEDLQYLSLGHAWALDDPTPERLEAALRSRSTPDCELTWNLEAPKNYFQGDAGRCLGHCWNLGMRGRSPSGSDVIGLLLQASAWDYESDKPSFANFESHALIHAQGGVVFYTHPARWWTGSWGGQGGYPRREAMRVSNMAVELPLDVLAGPTFDGLDVITGAGEFAADEKAFQLWSLLLNHGYRVAATASSDACFDRPGGAVPGAARLYTFIEGGFSLASAARAAAAGRTFVTTGPLLVTSLDGHPPGSALPADGRPRELHIEAWSSGAVTGGLARVEVLRNGEVCQRYSLEGQPTSVQTNLVIRDDRSGWYCVRAFGVDERRQRAISGAFFLDDQPWQAPRPVEAQIHVQVVNADSGRALDARLTEVTYFGTQPHAGATHRLPGGLGTVKIPATARLRAAVDGYASLTLSPFFDHPALLELVTRLEDRDLVDWRTFERIRALLGDVTLTFRLVRTPPE